MSAKVIDFAAVRASKGLVVPEPAKVQTAATVPAPAPKFEPPKYETTADVAKRIRQALKEKFPGVKFSVRSDNYSGGSSIRVRWTDGPTEKRVESVAKFGEIVRRDHFGDILEGGNRFVFCDRDASPELEAKAFAKAKRERGIADVVAPTLLLHDDWVLFRRVLAEMEG